MAYRPSGIAVSLAGRDKGKNFFVVGRTEKEVFLADGKLRKLENPKRKNIRHVKFLPDSGFTAVSGKITDQPVNAELRRAMAEFAANAEK